VAEPEKELDVKELRAEEEPDETDEEMTLEEEETADEVADEKETSEEFGVSPKEHPLKARAAPRAKIDTFLCMRSLCHIFLRA